MVENAEKALWRVIFDAARGSDVTQHLHDALVEISQMDIEAQKWFPDVRAVTQSAPASRSAVSGTLGGGDPPPASEQHGHHGHPSLPHSDGDPRMDDNSRQSPLDRQGNLPGGTQGTHGGDSGLSRGGMAEEQDADRMDVSSRQPPSGRQGNPLGDTQDAHGSDGGLARGGIAEGRDAGHRGVRDTHGSEGGLTCEGGTEEQDADCTGANSRQPSPRRQVNLPENMQDTDGSEGGLARGGTGEQEVNSMDLDAEGSSLPSHHGGRDHPNQSPPAGHQGGGSQAPTTTRQSKRLLRRKLTQGSEGWPAHARPRHKPSNVERSAGEKAKAGKVQRGALYHNINHTIINIPKPTPTFDVKDMLAEVTLIDLSSLDVSPP